MSKFTDDFAFTRGTGATRINAAGLIVGVDFSASSVTIGTGAKTFTLTADANVNRDWPVGSAVRVVDQVSANTMEGTVTTYTPSTQALVLDITSVTGSGTFTNWRIGSLEVRRDADGVLREPLRSNLVNFSSEFDNGAWSATNLTVTANATIAPNGSAQADKLVATGNNPFIARLNIYPTSDAVSFLFAKKSELNFLRISRTNVIVGAWFDLQNGVVSSSVGGATAVMLPFPNGWYLCGIVTSSNATGDDIIIAPTNADGASTSYTGNGVDGIFVWGANLQAGNTLTSHIPTTTVAVTRNADTFTFTPAAIAKFRQGQGALVIEANASDAGTAQRTALRLTGPSGEIRLGKQGVATSGNFTKMAEGGNVQLFSQSVMPAGVLKSDGLQYSEQSLVYDVTGLAVGALGASNSVAYDGSADFAILGSTSSSSVFLVRNNLQNLQALGIGGGLGLNGAHWNGSRFLISMGSPGFVCISTDGQSYRLINTPVITQTCNEVTSGMVGPTLRNVIVGNLGFIATSDDNGETWAARTSGTAVSLAGASYGTLSAVTRFLTCGSGNVILSSTDAITWANGTGQAGAFNDVHVANGVAVAVGATGVIYTSTNGTSWSAATSSGVVTTNVLRGVHYNASANLWVAVGDAGTIITAVDPTGTWTLQTSGTASGLTEVFYFNGLWIAASVSNVFTSPNAITWTIRNANVAATLIGLAASATRLITVGTAGGFASSEDGLTYTSRTNNNAILNGIAYGAGVYVSVGNAINGSGYIATIDGAGTVTRRVSGTTLNLANVKYKNGFFYAVSSDSGQAGSFRSTDGISWAKSVNVNAMNRSYSIAFDGEALVIIGSGSNASWAISLDSGLTYTTATLFGILTGTPNDIEYANGIFVTVSTNGQIVSGVRTGTTIAWTLRSSGNAPLSSVMYSTRDQRWYAAGNAGTLLYSEDNGVTWTSVNNAGFGAVSNTTLQASKLLPQWKSGRNTMALSYKANEVIVGLNGVAVTDTSNSIPSITAGVLGESFNGKIGPVYFYEFPKTLAEVIAITGVTR